MPLTCKDGEAGLGWCSGLLGILVPIQLLEIRINTSDDGIILTAMNLSCIDVDLDALKEFLEVVILLTELVDRLPIQLLRCVPNGSDRPRPLQIDSQQACQAHRHLDSVRRTSFSPPQRGRVVHS